MACEVIAEMWANADELFRRVQASWFVAEHGDQVCARQMAARSRYLKPSLTQD